MCGICGFLVNKNRRIVEYRSFLGRMTNLLSHRGPDRDGYYFADTGNSTVGLGHRRLSIIDLSEKAKQPMANEDKSVFVVFNGEIYNYRELTKELKSRGHIFRSNSDTEVIVHLYEDFGLDCVDKLTGMFSFAIWDKRKKRLFLARDHIGIKPLFYTFAGGDFFFASEIKSLLIIPQVSREINYKALDSYLTFGYIPAPATIFPDIKKLSAASTLTFDGSDFCINRYWSINYLSKSKTSKSVLTEELLELSKKVVKRHMVSDVPLGAFLSGGVDSSIIVALMNLVGEKPVETFSLGYESGGKDELEYAALVANHCGTDHHEFKINPEIIQILPDLLWHLDEPFFDNSIIPTYYISQSARKNVKVVLSGDGGDEMFGGYEWTRRHQYNFYYQKLPSPIRKIIAGLVLSDKKTLGYETDFMSKIRRLCMDLNSEMEDGFTRRTTVSSDFRYQIYSKKMKDILLNFNAIEIQKKLFSEIEVSDPREKMLYVDTMMFLPDDCLFKVDRMSMAHGLEVRVPFLDKELVEFSAAIPFEYKIRGLTSKYILKKAFSPYLPKKIFKQRKQGFTIPVSSWIRKDLQGLVRNVLLSPSLEKRDIFNKKALRYMLDEHQSGRQELGYRIWSIFVFEIWARLYLDAKIDSSPTFGLSDIV